MTTDREIEDAARIMHLWGFAPYEERPSAGAEFFTEGDERFVRLYHHTTPLTTYRIIPSDSARRGFQLEPVEDDSQATP